MASPAFTSRPQELSAPNRAANALRYALVGLFVLQVLLVGLRLGPCPSLLEGTRWPEALLLILTTLATGAALSFQLPLQNILLVFVLTGGLGGIITLIGAKTSVPFGPFYFTEHIGDELFPSLPAVILLLWIIVLLNCRGVARLILSPWRRRPGYGLWVLGLSTLLVILFDAALEPFAQSLELWRWHSIQLPLSWYGASPLTFLGWGLSSLLILAFVTPSLINKKPVSFPPNYYPLWIWNLLLTLLLTANLAHHLSTAVFLVGFQLILIDGLALLNRITGRV